VRPVVEPDLAELSPEPDDVFVLCSDGLTCHVEDDEIAEQVDAAADPDACVENLVDLANARGGDDNITVLILRWEKDEPS
jgi:protein phosphatase